MSLKERQYLYDQEIVNRNMELDFLSSPFVGMELETLEFMRISGALQYRPDLISRKYYGNSHMGWLIARHNLFMDPIFDFRQGARIAIPDLDDYFRYFKANSRSD